MSKISAKFSRQKTPIVNGVVMHEAQLTLVIFKPNTCLLVKGANSNDQLNLAVWGNLFQNSRLHGFLNKMTSTAEQWSM